MAKRAPKRPPPKIPSLTVGPLSKGPKDAKKGAAPAIKKGGRPR